MENKNNSEFKQSLSIINGALKSSLKKHKVLWGIGIAVIILLIILVILSSLLVNQNFVYSVLDKFIPESISSSDPNINSPDFYREMNPEFVESDTKIDDDTYILMYKYYYFDENGEKQYLDDDAVYHYTDENGEEQEIYVGIGFIYSGGEKLGNFIGVLKNLRWVAVAIVVIGLIVLWYVKDKKRNEENKPKRIRKADNKNQ